MLSDMPFTLLFYCLTLFLVATAFPAAENELSYERRAACNADNCLRALRARSVTASAACSAFLGTEPPTVISATSYTTLPTSTTYIIYTSPSVAKRGELEQRQTTVTAATSIPSYASACSGSVRFSSACSCLGISTPAPGPTTTIFETTETVTPLVATSTVCSPSDGYGYDVETISLSGTQYVQNFEIAMYANISDPYGCCVTCYQTPECFIYFINSGVCNLQYGTGSTDPNGSAQCPLGEVEVEQLIYFPTPEQGIGLGPCLPREVGVQPPYM